MEMMRAAGVHSTPADRAGLYLRTLLLALCCLAGLPDGTRAPDPAPARTGGTRPDVLRAAETRPQPFVARGDASLDGPAGALGGPAPRELHGSRTRVPAPAAVILHRHRQPRGFIVSVRRARLAGLARFGGTPPPPLHA